MNKEAVRHYVEEHSNLVSMKQTSNPDLFVLKYKNKVFYDNLWDSYLVNFRGTVVDKEFNVISRPFQKIYNYGIEQNAPRLPGSTKLTVYRKVNGFMVAITHYKDDILVSTTGSIDSDFVKMANEMIDKQKMLDVCSTWDGYTFLFECVHPNDPHIIPEQPGMYLLGWRENSWNSDTKVDHGIMKSLATQMGVFYLPMHNMTLDKLRSIVPQVTHEGFVAYSDDGVAFKIKSPYYLTHKLLARCKSLDKLLSPGIKQKIDEEFYPLLEYVQANIDEYSILSEQERLVWIRAFLEK